MAKGRRLAERAYIFPGNTVVRLRTSQRDVVEHFDAEYGEIRGDAASNPAIEVVAGVASGVSSHRWFQGSHKTVRWRVRIADLDKDPTLVYFEGRGALVVSFLQTFYIEPLMRLKFAARDLALVHAASVVGKDGSVIFPAGSAVGKSTLTLQHAAAGFAVQGDNYVAVTPNAETLHFPRRIRVYPDLSQTNPELFRRLPSNERRRLRISAWVRRLSLGYANLPRRLHADDITGRGSVVPCARLSAVYVLEPWSEGALSGPAPLSEGATIERIRTIGDREAARLRDALNVTEPGEGTVRIFERATYCERQALRQALSGVPCYELKVPRVRNPAVTVAEIRRLAGLTNDR